MNRTEMSATLQQRWLHSHEEDSPGEQVYRPASYPFPRSRGRSGFELKPDQGLVEIQPGANDVPATTTGTWTVDEENNLLLSSDASTRTLPIIAAEKDRLILGR